MSFQDAVRTCLQQKYADFNGRARRSEFWFFVLFTVIVGIVAGVIDLVLGTTGTLGGYGLVGTVAQLALLVPGIAVGVRRLHDTGRAGWLVALVYAPVILTRLLAFTGSTALIGLLGLVTLVGGIVLIVFWAQDGNPGDNQYGPNPKALGGGEYGQPYQQMPPPAPPQY